MPTGRPHTLPSGSTKPVRTDDPLRRVALREELGMRPGGFGVLLAQQLVDELIYGQDGNEVLLIKYLDSAKPKSP